MFLRKSLPEPDAGASSFAQKLGSVSYYEAAIERLHRKFTSETPFKLYEETEEGFQFAQIIYDKKSVAKLMAQAFARGEYQFAPATINRIMVGDKLRDIYAFPIFDRLAHSALFAMLSEDLQQTFSAHVFSYTKGLGRMDAIEGFMTFVRKHRSRHDSPLNRGLYTYRFDIKSYGESIPVHPQSLLWQQFDDLFGRVYGRAVQPYEKQLLESLVRPVVVDKHGNLHENIVGIPDGAPITSLVLNLYVTPIDEFLGGVEGGFYARFGDDLIFAHENYEIFHAAITQVDVLMEQLQLRRNLTKTKTRFFNAAGRAGVGDVQGATIIEFLGMELHFDGTAALKRDKIDALIQDLRARSKITARMFAARSFDEQGARLCDMINKMFDHTYPMANAYAVFLRKVVNHREQLRELDYRIARLVLQTLTGDASVKKFREIPYKKLREQWKLISLEYIRNK